MAPFSPKGVVFKGPSLKINIELVLVSNQNDQHLIERTSECVKYMCLSFEESAGPGKML